MGTGLVGEVWLQNEQRVYVTWLARPLGDALRQRVAKLRTVCVIDADGNPIKRIGMLAFGREPNPDASDGTYVGTLLDVTPNLAAADRHGLEVT